MVELVPTKLPNYVLPAFRRWRSWRRFGCWRQGPAELKLGWRRYLPLVAAAQCLIGLAALAAAPFLLPAQF